MSRPRRRLLSSAKRTKQVDLKPNGGQIEVTDANKIEYLLLLANYRLAHRTEKQIQAFADGFFSIIPKDLVCIFDESELELLVCGMWSLPWFT